MSPQTVRSWVETRQIDAYLLNGRTLRFSEDAVETFAATRPRRPETGR
ncbi:MAG: hypothetical protein WCG47_17595 [Dermatophilaceae bacterium]